MGVENEQDNMAADLAAAMSELGGDNEQAASPSPAPEPSPAPSPAPAESTGRVRDESGRFAPRTAAEQVPAPASQQGQQQQVTSQPPAPPTGTEVQPTNFTDRAPISWKPALREKWASLDPDVRLEIMRREREIDTGLRTSAEQRRLAEEVQRTIAPYEMLLRQEGATPVQAIDNLFRTVATLRTAPQPQRASIVADIVMNYGVDLEALDQVLTARLQGRQAPNQIDPVMQAIDQRLQPLQQFVQQFQTMQQQSQQRVQETAATEMDKFFNDPANEFAELVREDMADLLEMAARRGVQMTLQDAYKRATLAHPQIAEVISQRQLQQAASQQTAAAQRARQASASLPSSGAPSQSGAEDLGDDVRSAIVASMRQHSGS